MNRQNLLKLDTNDTFDLALGMNLTAGSGLLTDASDKSVSNEEIANKLRNSSFMRQNFEALRERLFVMKNDPATYRRQLELNERTLAQLFIDAGSKVSKKRLKRLAKQVYLFKVETEQLRKIVADSIDFDQPYVRGIAGEAMQSVRSIADSYGFRLQDGSPELIQAVKDIITKQRTENDIKLSFANEAKRLFPAFSARFDTGATLLDVADPYIEMMASMWEMPKSSIGFDNSFLREALQAMNPKDGSPMALSLTDWRQKLMQAPKFMGTLQAQTMFLDGMSNLVSKWGLNS